MKPTIAAAALAASLPLSLAGCGGDGPAAAADPGARVYSQHCMACHQRNGRGLGETQPSLVGTPTVSGDPEALACLDRAVALNPLLPLARVNRARVLAELARYEDALDDCDFFLRCVAGLEPVEAVRRDIVERALGVPMIGLPVANHDNRQHAPNENARIGNLWSGIDLYAALLTGLEW